MHLKLTYLFLLVCLILYYQVVPADMDKFVMGTLLGILFLCLILFIIRKEKNNNLKGQFFKHSSFILLGVVIVHFQYYLDYILGNTPVTNKFIWADTRIVIEAMVISLIGVIAFLLGYLFFRNIKMRPISLKKDILVNTNVLLFVVAASLITYFMTVNPLYLLGYYGEEKIGTAATYAIMIFRLSTYAIIIQNCRNMIIKDDIPANFRDYLKKQGHILTFFIAIYLLSVMFSGDRGPLMTFAICYASGYFFVKKHKMSLRYGALLILGGATFITILGQVRRMDNNLSFSDRFAQSIDANLANDAPSISPQTKELAGSVKSLHEVVKAVPKKFDYLYGRLQFQQVANSIPFFETFNPLIFEDQHYKFGGSARYVTWLVQGDNPSYGNGTSCITDFYLDLGLLGVILGMFLFGYSMRFAEVTMFSYSFPTLFGHVFFVVYLSNAIYISRSTVLFQFKSVVLIFLILIANRYLTKKRV